MDKNEQQYLNFMLGNIYDDRISYLSYKEKGKPCCRGNIDDLEIISLLDELGFPIDQVGTYLYKELIMAIISQLKGIPVRSKVLTDEELMEELNNPFSQFYFDIARNDLDIGIKTFHAAIKEAISNVKINGNAKLYEQILGDNFNLWDYSLNALLIAKHYLVLKEIGKQDNFSRVRETNRKIVGMDFSANQ